MVLMADFMDSQNIIYLQKTKIGLRFKILQPVNPTNLSRPVIEHDSENRSGRFPNFRKFLRETDQWESSIPKTPWLRAFTLDGLGLGPHNHGPADCKTPGPVNY